MASYPDKMRLPVEAADRSSFPLNCSHTSTADFMTLQTSYYRHLMPKQHLDVNAATFARLLPLPQPTVGSIEIHNRAFFVPYRVIWPAWTDFISDLPSFAGGQTTYRDSAPYFTISSFIAVMINGTMSQPATKADSSKDWYAAENRKTYDFVWVKAGQVPGDSDFRKLTYHGRNAMKVMNTLGYNIPIDNTFGDTKISALALLAFVKVYIDYYWPPQYFGDPLREILSQYFEDNAYNGEVNQQWLQLALYHCAYVCYDSDYFTSAFDSPVGPEMGDFTSLSFVDSTFVSTSVNPTAYPAQLRVSLGVAGDSNSPNNTPLLTPAYSVSQGASTAANNRISQYGLLTLEALTKYARRHQVAGSRALDRYLSQFGVSLSAEKLKRSVYLGSQIVPVDIGDVMSNADTASSDGAYLGSYAGKGFAYGQDGHFSCDTDEFGIFFVLTSIVPKVGYVQGMDRNNLHLGLTDFFTPQFDALGNQAIARQELYVPHSTDPRYFDPTSLMDGIFGFVPRYAEYKTARDWLTGDFALNSMNGGGETSSGWHLNRLFDAASFTNNADNMVHSRTFVQGNTPWQYDRIFHNTSNSADHFILVSRFNVKTSAPCRPLYDDILFEDDEHDTKVDVQVNGVRAN